MRRALLALALALTSGAAPAQTAPAGTAPKGGAPATGGTPRAEAPATGARPKAAAPAAGSAEREALAHVMVSDPAALDRVREPLTFGVPFPEAVLQDPAELRCWRAKGGEPLPVQARTLSHWPDGSVRWALVDTQLPMHARDRLQLAIGRAGDIPPTPSPWALRVLPRTVTLTDGETTWPLLERGAPGAAADRVAGLTPRLVDRFEHTYGGVVDLHGAEMLEWGPLRATVLLRGEHRTLDGAGLPIAFYTFTARVSVLAGCRSARVQWTLENTPLDDPPGMLAFRSYELLLDPGPEPRRCVLPVVGVPEGKGGDVPFLLRQNGTEATRCFAYVAGKTVKGLGPEDLWAGIVADLGGTPRGSFVHRTDSAHNHPAALMYAPGGALRIGLLPASEGFEYWLDDATQKTFRLDLALTGGAGAEADGRELMLAARRPALVTLDPHEVADSLAWGDAGLMTVPDVAPRAEVYFNPNPPTSWADWGEWNTKSTRTSGSPRNGLSVFLEFVQTGRADLFTRNLARAWHAMDLRPFHIRGFLASEHPRANLYEGTPHTNEPPQNRLGRTGIEQRFPEYKTGLPQWGHGYNGFESEHMALDDIYECWLLTGDWVAHDALVSAGEAMLTWRTVMPGGDLWAARNVGWTLRALMQVYRATGEKRYLEAAALQVATADKERGRGEVKYLRKGWADARHIADEASEAPWMTAIAIHGFCAYYAETHDPLVPPLLADLTTFIMSAYRGTNGFAADLPTGRPTRRDEPASPLGTSTWVPGAVGAAAFVTGNHEPVDRLYPYYRFLATTSQRPASFGTATWNWWQPYLLSLQSRYGQQAVSDPAKFNPPSAAGR